MNSKKILVKFMRKLKLLLDILGLKMKCKNKRVATLPGNLEFDNLDKKIWKNLEFEKF